MSLIVTDYLHRGYEVVPEDGSDLYLHMDDKYLEAYDLVGGDKLIGSLKEVRRVENKEENVDRLVDLEIGFRIGDDLKHIFISDFPDDLDVLRFGSGFWMKVFITHGVKNGERFSLFGKRKIKINNLENPEVHCPSRRYFMRNRRKKEEKI